MRLIIVLLFIFTFCNHHIKAQGLFEKGHYQNLSLENHNGYIDLNSVTDNEPYILYKTKHRAKADTIYNRNIQELQVSGFKFLREQTRVLSSESTLEQKVFIQKSLFLEVELEGQATLYSTRSNNRYTFYYAIPGQPIEELVFIEYIRNDGQVARMNTFRDQLTNNLKCGSPDYSSLEYTEDALISVFTAFNECSNSDYTTFKGIPALSWKYLNVGVGSGLSANFLESTNTVTDQEIAHFSNLSPYFEADIEYLIPSLKNRIGLFMTGGYLKFSDRDQRNILGTPQEIRLSYEVIQTQIGVRGYLPFNNTLKLYAEFGFGRDFEVGDGITLDYELEGNGYNDFEDPSLTGHLTGGIGLAFLNRYILEAKFRHLNTQLSPVSSDQRIRQGILTVGFKYLLKSYYK